MGASAMRDRVEALLEAGVSNDAIALEVGLPLTSVWSYRSRWRIATGQAQRPTQAQEGLLRDAWPRGEISSVALARTLGVGCDVVAAWARFLKLGPKMPAPNMPAPPVTATSLHPAGAQGTAVRTVSVPPPVPCADFPYCDRVYEDEPRDPPPAPAPLRLAGVAPMSAAGCATALCAELGSPTRESNRL